MNPASIVKLISAKNQFSKSHPKFVAFMKSVLSREMEEGTVIEVTVTRPDEEPVTANLKILQSDLELVEGLKGLTQ